MIAYLFDVDGVLTDPVAKRVIEPELFSVLSSFLLRGDLVGINTGRSFSWIQERIIEPLFEKRESKDLYSDMIAVTEKGGTWVTFDGEGSPKHTQDQTMIVPQELNERIKQLVEEKYIDSMFFDRTKETMISVEMLDEFDISEFHARQKEFVKEVEVLLLQTEHGEKYKIDPSTISTDIEEKHAGKALGVDRLLSLFAEKDINPSKFVAFGDSPSDLAMADELTKRGKDVTFVYTGDKEKLGEIEKSYPIEFAEGYTRGTLAYLKGLGEHHS